MLSHTPLRAAVGSEDVLPSKRPRRTTRAAESNRRLRPLMALDPDGEVVRVDQCDICLLSYDHLRG